MFILFFKNIKLLKHFFISSKTMFLCNSISTFYDREETFLRRINQSLKTIKNATLLTILLNI